MPLSCCGPGIGTSHIDSLASQYIVAGRLKDDGIFTNIAAVVTKNRLDSSESTTNTNIHPLPTYSMPVLRAYLAVLLAPLQARLLSHRLLELPFTLE